MLDELGTGQGYLKAGLLGFQKSGKSWTAVALAIGTWKFFGSKGRIVFFDTEGGSEYVSGLISRQTAKPLLGKKARAFKDLLSVTKDLHEDDVFLVDSITHPWRELCDAHLARINEFRSKKDLKPRTKLEFQDWGPIKAEWSKWTDFYLNSKVHIIIAGRAGDIYSMERDEETNKNELIKTGIKMKTESEFGFEPSLLVEMERVQTVNGKREIIHRATVIGDRFNAIDGKQIDFKGGGSEAKAVGKVFDFFKPHLDLLKPGASSPINTEIKSDTGVGEDGDVEFHKMIRERDILLEEIKAELIKAGMDGRSEEDKKNRVLLLEKVFGTPSWTKIERMQVKVLRTCLKVMKDALKSKSDPVAQDPDDAFDPQNEEANKWGPAKKKVMDLIPKLLLKEEREAYKNLLGQCKTVEEIERVHLQIKENLSSVPA